MKIAQISCTFPPYRGGIGNVAYHFAENLSSLGHEVTVITPKQGIAQPDDQGFLLDEKNTFIKKGNASVMKIKPSDLNIYDAIHFHYPFFGTAEILWFYLVFKRINKPFFIHYHMDVHGLPWHSIPFSLPSKLCFSSLVKASQAVTCASLDYVQNSDIKSVYKEFKEKFYEVPFGVDTRRFFPASIEQENKTPTILFLGALDKAHSFKGLDLLISALADLKKETWQLHVVGGGALLGQYKEQAKQLGLEDRINFFGRVSDQELPRRYQEADFFVFPSISRNEAFGLVLLEAMASGLPVITSDLPGVRSVFRQNEHGKIFQTNNSKDLRQKILFFLNNKETIRKWGREVGAYTKEKYSWKASARLLEDLYKKYL